MQLNETVRYDWSVGSLRIAPSRVWAKGFGTGRDWGSGVGSSPRCGVLGAVFARFSGGLRCEFVAAGGAIPVAARSRRFGLMRDVMLRSL
jgi:hypothetical protein